MKLQLPTVTLVCIDSIDPIGSSKVLEICKSKVDFGAVKLLTDKQIDYEHRAEIMPLNSLIMYSVFCLTELYKYIDTENLLIVQKDGFILNPQSFKMEWLELDYLAPLFIQYDKVGSGGFSLRSKKLMEYAAFTYPKWDGTESHANYLQSQMSYYEDGELSMGNNFKHFKISSLEQAADFAQGGNRTPKYFRQFPFGFHRTLQEIDFNTGEVEWITDNVHLKNSYDEEIEMLFKTLSRQSYTETFQQLRDLGMSAWDNVKCVCSALGRSKCELNCKQYEE